jgi:hypothetical protein
MALFPCCSPSLSVPEPTWAASLTPSLKAAEGAGDQVRTFFKGHCFLRSLLCSLSAFHLAITSSAKAKHSGHSHRGGVQVWGCVDTLTAFAQNDMPLDRCEDRVIRPSHPS